jgi:hypothetical protein
LKERNEERGRRAAAARQAAEKTKAKPVGVAAKRVAAKRVVAVAKRISKSGSAVRRTGSAVRRTGSAVRGSGSGSPRRASIQAKRVRLAAALQRLLRKRKLSLESRVSFAKIVRKYLVGIKSCVHKDGGRIGLHDEAGNLRVRFAKRIGTESAFGMAYLNTGTKLARLIKFSSKVMSKSEEHAQEIELLKKMSSLAEKGLSPNMPLLYRATDCDVPCDACDPASERLFRSPYYVVVNELADGDLINWFKDKHTGIEYESVVMQVMLAVRAFHGLGYAHNDCHLGNFLYHKVAPGGYWRYNIQIAGESKPLSLFVPNTGTLVVMWDPGLATPLSATRTGYDDYIRPLQLIASVQKYYKPPRHPATQPITRDLRDDLIGIVEELKPYANKSSATIMQYMAHKIQDEEIFPEILAGERVKVPRRRISKRGSKIVLTKFREGGRTVEVSKTVAPKSLMGKIVPIRGYNLIRPPKLPRGITVRRRR